MSLQRNESLGMHQQIDGDTQPIGNDRSGLFGLLALLGLAFPALGIRYLFPDLNPLFLAGFGIAVYGVYLGLQAYLTIQTGDPELALEPVVANTQDRHLLNEGRSSQ